MIDLKQYAGRWIARNGNGEITGTGKSCLEARSTSGAGTPVQLAWVSPHPPHLALPEWPLERLRPLFAGKDVWLAGGAVRDLLLGRTLHDWDFTTAGPAMALARQVANGLRGAYVTLDDEHDTARAIVREPATGRPITLDFATLRKPSIEADLHCRDFTINAIAMTLEGELIDPTDGQADLTAGIVRAASDQAFQQDPARLLRAVRAASELGCRIEPATQALIRAQAEAITTVSAERVQAELLRIVALEAAAPALHLTDSLSLLQWALPEVQGLQSVTQSYPHYRADAYTHTLDALTAIEALLTPASPEIAAQLPAPSWCWEMAESTLAPLRGPLRTYLEEPLAAEMPRHDLLKWGALLHDIGKSATRTVDAEERVHFYGHDRQGATLAEERLNHLRFPNQARDFVTTLVREHMRLIGMSKTPPPTRKAIYHFYRDAGDAGPAVVLLALADALAVWGPAMEKAYWGALLITADALLRGYFEHHDEVVAPPPLLNGHDLTALGIAPGPAMGKLLALLREAQAAGEITTRADAEAFIHSHSSFLIPNS